MSLIHAAIERQEAQPTPKPIDYERMNRTLKRQRAALARAVKTNDPEKIAAVCKAAVAEWDEIGAWPDDWSTWQRALNDALPWNKHIGIEYL
jgi:hypothetical protein